MWWFVPLLAAAAAAADPTFELIGRILPPPDGRASVSVYGATSPFTTAALSDELGRFTVKKLEPGTYTVAVFLPGRGEARQTIEVGPGTADSRNRVAISLNLKDADFTTDALKRRHAVSAKELTIPDKAVREYEDAQKDLEKHQTAAAVKHLEAAVEIAPQFSGAWNNLGTIAYQTRKFLRAEECFRKALKQDPEAYEPLVNLGGVLINLRKLDEAMEYNLHAVLVRPNDALANSQLGMTYFELKRPDLAEKYFVRARQLDPAHFSHPQLFLAEIHLQRGNKRATADDLEDFLRQHPDWPEAAKMRETIAKLREEPR
ncbi:MAG TPA: tetratricopeptide repeat protein [Bryobacteraceae bacterium]